MSASRTAELAVVAIPEEDRAGVGELGSPEPERYGDRLALDRDAGFMRMALAAAGQASECGEVPVGAVIVVGGEVVAVAHNQRETKNDPTAHAEIVAMRAAAARLASWRLVDAELYVTMEPCPMCAGAIVNARIRRLIYGCDDPKAGAVRTLFQLLDDPRLNHRVEVVPGVLAGESAALLKSFFSRLRVR